MTNAQKLRLRLSQVRQRLNEIASLEGDDFSDEIRAEAETLQTEYRDLEIRNQAAIVAEGEAETRATEGPDAERRERLELRSRASLTSYIQAALSGRQVSGAEAELQERGRDRRRDPARTLGYGPDRGPGDPPGRAHGRTGSTVGVNLDRIRPAVFANSIAPRLGIEMPRVESGSYASATITTSLSAASHAKGGKAQATAAAFTVSTVTPKRISARLGIRVEDIAAVGQANFESILRENLALVLSDALDDQVINGSGGNSGADLIGIFERLTDPSDPTAVADFDAFAAAHAAGIDGLWSSTLSEVGIVCGPSTMALSARRLFRPRRPTKARRARPLMRPWQTGGLWTNKRMPDAVSTIQQAILLPLRPVDDGRLRCHADERLPALGRDQHRRHLQRERQR